MNLGNLLLLLCKFSTIVKKGAWCMENVSGQTGKCEGNFCWKGPSRSIIESLGPATGVGWPEKHASVEDCAKRCEQVADCQAFHYYWGSTDCYLQKGGNISPPLADGKDRIAGVFTRGKCEGNLCWKGPSRSIIESLGPATGVGWPEKHASVEDCAKRCEDLADCQAFHYYWGLTDCYLQKGGIISPPLADGKDRLAGVVYRGKCEGNFCWKGPSRSIIESLGPATGVGWPEKHAIVEDCAKRCEDLVDCQAFHYYWGLTDCYLQKGGIISPPLADGKDRIAGVINRDKCEGNFCWKGPSRSIIESLGPATGVGWPEKHASVEDCAKRCEDLADCQAFHYYWGLTHCYLQKGGIISPPLADGKDRLAGVFTKVEDACLSDVLVAAGEPACCKYESVSKQFPECCKSVLSGEIGRECPPDVDGFTNLSRTKRSGCGSNIQSICYCPRKMNNFRWSKRYPECCCHPVRKFMARHRYANNDECSAILG